MRFVDYNTVKQNMGNSIQTVQDFGNFIGASPYTLGIAAQLYPQNVASALLDRLFNVHQLSANKDKFKNSDDMVFQWGIDTNKIKQVKIVANVTTDGSKGGPVTIRLEERYFNPHDSFRIEGSRDTLLVMGVPIKRANNDWEYTCRFVTDDISRGLNLPYAVKNKTVRFLSNHHPELSDKGYFKLESNAEMHRNYLTLHRVDGSSSGQFSLQNHRFIERSTKDRDGNKKMTYFKMDKMESLVYQDFMKVRNENLLWGRANFDAKGKCLIQTEDGRNIPMGDGIITQVERYAQKYTFTKLTVSRIRDVIKSMNTLAQNATGNHYLIIANEEFQYQWNDAMTEELKGLALPATAFYSKGISEKGIAAKEYAVSVKGMNELAVGASFTSYEYAQNTVTLAVERAMSNEYSDRAYAIMMDVTPDLVNGRPAIELFTLEGADMLTGTLKGLGGKTGKESGDMSSPIHGWQHAIAGYSGVAVYNPHRSFVMEQAVLA